MPVYEYECLKCKKRHEIMQRITENPLIDCPDCGGKMKKIISSTSFVLKGTGWYATDYASGNHSGGDSTTKKAHDTKSESKPENKAETKAEKKSPTEAAASK
jgi:putative FmdB family regulatory protein